MQVLPTNYTIATYCHNMEQNSIIVNREYQRSSKVWPAPARAYLIDTVLQGYPIHKLSLYQKTDVKTRQTIHEIVDGQQRSQTILDYYLDKFRISGNSEYSGLSYSALEEADQARFLSYQLGVDVFVGATEEQIRQVFRRMNSYTIPLNPQEKRHADYQGVFKWFMVALSEQYAQPLKNIGVFSERDLVRMGDVALLADIIMSSFEGIGNASESRLNDFYKQNEIGFTEAPRVEAQLDAAFAWLFEWRELHRGPLMKAYNIYSLILALIHRTSPLPVLQGLVPLEQGVPILRESALANLSVLASSLEEPDVSLRYTDFMRACLGGGTNRARQRATRFEYFCDALDPMTSFV